MLRHIGYLECCLFRCWPGCFWMLVHRGGQLNEDYQPVLKALGEEERKLDELIQSCTEQIHELCEDCHSHRYPLSVQLHFTLYCHPGNTLKAGLMGKTARIKILVFAVKVTAPGALRCSQSLSMSAFQTALTSWDMQVALEVHFFLCKLSTFNNGWPETVFTVVVCVLLA